MIFLKVNDNIKKNKYEIQTVSLMLMKISYLIALLCYGIIIASLLQILGINSSTFTFVLVVVYALEFLLLLTNKLSIAKIMSALLCFVILYHIWVEILRSYDKSVRFDVFKSAMNASIKFSTDLYLGIKYEDPLRRVHDIACLKLTHSK